LVRGIELDLKRVAGALHGAEVDGPAARRGEALKPGSEIANADAGACV